MLETTYSRKNLKTTVKGPLAFYSSQRVDAMSGQEEAIGGSN
jgi:hypothetical protein